MSRTVVTMLRTAAQRYAELPYLSVKTDAGWPDLWLWRNGYLALEGEAPTGG